MTTTDKSYQQMRKEFQDKFFKELSPILQKYDNERKRKLIFAIVSICISCILWVLLWIFVFDFVREAAIHIIVFTFGTSCIIWCAIKKSFENIIHSTKLVIDNRDDFLYFL